MNTPSYNHVVRNTRATAINKVLKQAYMLLGLSMIPTLLGVMLEAKTLFLLTFMIKSPIAYMVTTLALFYGLVYAINRNNTNMLGIGLMFVFTFLMGLSLGPLITFALKSAEGFKMIGIAAGGTGALFLGLAAIGSDSNRDFSSFGKVIGISVLLFMGTMLLNFFFLKMPMLNLILSMIIIPLSGMTIVYHINQAVRGGENNYISLALSIYIGLYNIFSAILRLLLAFNND